MKIKLEINKKEKEVIIKGLTKSHRSQYFKKASKLDKINSDESVDNEIKLNEAENFINWLQELGLEYSDLTDEEKSSLDLEELDKITDCVRGILQPNLEKKS